MSSKGNTLFSYFTKSPKSGSPSHQSPVSNSTKSSNRSLNSVNKQSDTPSRTTGKTKLKDKTALNRSEDAAIDCDHTAYDIAWAKLEGYPFWPAIICPSPGKSTQNFKRLQKKAMEIHVQFFDDQRSRSWIKLKFLKKLTGPNHPELLLIKDNALKKGVEEACKALEMKKSDRESLVVTHLESDHEDYNLSSISDENSEDENIDVSNHKKRSLDKSSPPLKKRRRIRLPSDSESEDEYKPDKIELLKSDDEDEDVDSSLSLEESEEELSADNSSPEKKPVSKSKKKTVKIAPPVLSTPKSGGVNLTPVRDSTKSKLLAFSPAITNTVAPVVTGKIWAHLKLDWLNPDQIRDIKENPKSHPDYNPHTLLVPNSFKQGLTPALRQWWEMKSKHYDTVLFFKVGKFYELYHMDAVTGINELNLKEMAGDFAHSGFPEISYGRYSSMLIEKGYKVARVEQTETPAMMEVRCKKMAKPTKFDKVVSREICGVTTKGTRTFGVQDGEIVGSGNNYLLALAEKEVSNGDSIYGVTFVDTSIGKFHLGQFTDDRHGSRLRTLIAHFPPSQVLFERNRSSSKTQTILNGCLSSVLKESLQSGSEFWDASKTLKLLAEAGYFKGGGTSDNAWPKTLKKMIDSNDLLNQSPQEQYELAIKALGACTWYLKLCCIDEEVLSMKNFEEYVPPDNEANISEPTYQSQRLMILDGVTLKNLEVLENTFGTTEGTLLEAMESCYTPFGKRLFHQWLCSPLCNPDSINDRLNAIEDLQKSQHILEDLSKLIKKLPDLERLLSRIHAQGSKRRSESHPDSRAVFYEDGVYTKQKIGYFVNALQGFKTAVEVNQLINDPKLKFSSKLLKEVVLKEEEGGRFPHLKDILLFFDNAFDHEKAKKEGKIEPSSGVDEDFDSAVTDIKKTKAKLDEYLEKEKRNFGCKVTFFSSGKNRFQLEVPEHACKQAASTYELVSSKKGFKRFWTQDIKAQLAKLVCAEEKKEVALKDIMRRLFHQFNKHYRKWDSAVGCLSVLDALLSLVQYVLNSQVTMCRPTLVPPGKDETLHFQIKEGSHPALIKFLSGGDFIPNDISFGSEKNPEKNHLVLVTGPNMGGKSTLMRQAGLLTIMAQMGSFVPAEHFELTPVDRVFTRLGASDNILEGESTFFVELSETASILKHASKHSLVLLDELGRGTATYDGTAIACAVAQDLACRLKCRTLFSTHYHSLVDHFSNNPSVKLGHMACMVENENEEDPTQETITFLYKFVEGACPKSYGFNAARLAGIPDMIIRAGYQKAKQFEEKCNRLKMLRLLFRSASSKSVSCIKNQLLAV